MHIMKHCVNTHVKWTGVCILPLRFVHCKRSKMLHTFGLVYIFAPTTFRCAYGLLNLLSKCSAKTYSIDAFDASEMDEVEERRKGMSFGIYICEIFFVCCNIHISLRLVSSNSTLFQTSPYGNLIYASHQASKRWS